MLKNLTLIIPTHGRVEKQITLQALPPSLRKQTILVASLPEEAKRLRTLHPDNEVIVAKGTNNIAQKRHWIMKNVGGRVLFMMDDDMAFFTRCPEKYRRWTGSAWILRNPAGKVRLVERRYPDKDAAAIEAAFQAMDKRIDTHTPSMICSGHRRHNDKQPETWGVNQRMMYAFGVDKDVYTALKIRFDAVKVREDFHVVLSMLRKGQTGNTYHDLVVDTYGEFSAKGGCHDERSMELSNEQCYALQKLHPEFVKVVDRAYKGSIPRKEVVVAWKKAYESSQR